MYFQMTKRDLLLSTGDEISPMSGVNLVKDKVHICICRAGRKPILPQVNLVAIMGGGYPSSEAMFPFGSEFNFDCGKVTASPIVHSYPPLCGACPCDIYIASVAWAPPWNVEALHSKPLTSCLRKLGLSSSDLRCVDLGSLDK